MNSKSCVLILVLIVSLFSNEKNITIFRANRHNDRQIEKVVKRHLPSNVTVTRSKPVTSVGSVRQALSSNPDFLLFLDATSAETYFRYQSSQRGSVPPSVIVSDIKKYMTYTQGIPSATIYGVLPSLSEVVSNAKSAVPSLSSVGVLHTNSQRTLVNEEVSQYRSSGKTITSVPLTGAVSSDLVRSGLRKFSSGAKTVIWLAGSEMNSLIKNEENIRSELKRRAGAVITTERSVAEALRNQIPVLLVSRDAETVGALMASRVAMAFRNNSAAGSGDMKIGAYKTVFYSGTSSKTFAPSSAAKAGQLVNRAVRLLEQSYASKDSVKEIKVAEADTKPAPEKKAKPKVVATSSKKVEKPIENKPKNAIANLSIAENKKVKEEAIAVEKPEEEEIKEESNEPLRRITITTAIANVFSDVEPEPLLMAVAKAGDEFILLDSLDEYLQIKAWGRVGFIHTSEVAEITPIPEPQIQFNFYELLADSRFVPVLAGSIGVLILLLLIVLIRVRALRIRKLHYRSALLLSKKPSELKIEDDGKMKKLRKYLYQSGTDLVQVKSTAKLQNHMIRHMPDLILVDWRVHGNVSQILRKQLSKYRLSSATTVLFYHVSENERHQLQDGFGDAEIHIFPTEPDQRAISMILAGQGRAYTNGSSSGAETTSYLAGMITGSCLQDVLQLIETGRKEGCFVVEDDDPFAAIFFRDGIIVYAATRDGIVGIEAIYEVLKKDEGSFYFMLDRTAPQENISLSVMAILMEWSSKQDQEEMRRTLQMQAVADTPSA